MNNNLNKKEQEALSTQRGASAVIMGYLKAERGKIAPSVFNNIVTNLGYDKLKKDELKNLAKEVQDDNTLNSLYVKGFNREIKLDDIPDSDYEEGKVTETNLFNQITNYLIDKEDDNARLRELRKLQREGVYMEILMRELRKNITEELKGMPRGKYLTTEPVDPVRGDKSMILVLSDWHIGFVSKNMVTGDYNFEKAVHSIKEIKEFVLREVEEQNIKKLYVVHLGDIAEKVDMRNVSQAFDAEFPFAEQISKGVRVIADLLAQLSKFVDTTFGILGGNHDRMSGNKDVVNNDSAAYIVLDLLFMMQEDLGQLPNVTLVDNRDNIYRADIKVAGSNVVCVHGDKGAKKGKMTSIFQKDEPIDIILSGHLHNFAVSQEDYHRLHIQCGGLIGENTYSRDHNFPATAPSQTVIVLREGYKTPNIIPIMLNNDGAVY